MAKEPLVLEPSSQWMVNYGDDSCRLARTFGTGDAQIAFYLEDYGTTSSFQLVVAGSPLRRAKNYLGLYYQFGPSQLRQRSEPLIGTLGQYDPSFIISTGRFAPLSEEELAAKRENRDVPEKVLSPSEEESIVWLGLGTKSDDIVRLDLGPMKTPMDSLRTCNDELLTHWGIDVDAHRTLSREVVPLGNPGTWVTPKDYPTGMLRKGQPGLVQVRLMVDPVGKPSSCHIQQSTRPQEFDDAVCAALMRRAMFEPALDAGGRPIASYWQSSVRFQIY
ncbi:MAG: TonB family protein [Betaproteobacteria bacterium]|nr:TonB family protein [Betaproteobacteria bacterium]